MTTKLETNLEVGKVYICPERFLLLFPDIESIKEVVTSLSANNTGRIIYQNPSTLTIHGLTLNAPGETSQGINISANNLRNASILSSVWTHQLDKEVSYCEPRTVFLILSLEGEYIKILALDKIGWIPNEDVLKLKEIKNG